MDRRTTLKWVLAAAAAAPLRNEALWAADGGHPLHPSTGYGTDPNLMKDYKPGELWPLTLNPSQRRAVSALCDLIIPADEKSPSASAVGVVDFIDEWISAPYPRHRDTRAMILEGLEWIDSTAQQRFKHVFAEINTDSQRIICDEICYEPKAPAALAKPAKFFTAMRNLTVGGFYSTPQGREDLQYMGNTPLERFDGPPLEVLRKVGLA
jgi:hypothetical protein